MESGKKENKWERTNVTNLLRNRESGNYYARVKVNGKQKWRTLETTVFSVAKLRLGDVERELRAQGGARVDAAPSEKTRQLLAGVSSYQPADAAQEIPLENVHFPLLRQFSHEVLSSRTLML